MPISHPVPKLFRLTVRVRLLPALLALGVADWLYATAATETESKEPAVPSPLLPLLLECEDIEFKASWITTSSFPGASGGSFLFAASSKSDALTVIEVPRGGTYAVWSRSLDFARIEPGTRRFLVLVNGSPAGRESGQHRTQGFAWEKVGVAELATGRNAIGLRDSARHYSRPDAILLAPPGFDPTNKNPAELQSFRIKPVPALPPSPPPPPLPALRQEAAKPVPEEWGEGARELAAIESAAVRMSFIQAAATSATSAAATTATPRPRIGRRIALRKNNHWEPVPFAPDGEELFVLFSPSDPDLNTATFIPSWSPDVPIRIEAAGREYEVRQTPNPFSAGALVRLRATAVRQTSASQLAVEYAGERQDRRAPSTTTEIATANVTEIATTTATAPATAPLRITASAVWTLDGASQRLRLAFNAPETGAWSIGFAPFQEWTRDQAEFVQLPPLFQMQRLPDYPVMLASATMPHPLALVQATPAGSPNPFTWSVAADPDCLPFEWGRRRNSPYGFSLLNARNQVQGVAFSPVPGMDGSRIEAGRPVTATFIASCLPGDWKDGLAALSGNVFRVTDYREPVDTSLSDAALNMIDLLKNPAASGWDAKLRGHYNIESENTVTHASPLAALSAARLTQDPELFANRALPTIEYTLSRQLFHHAPKPALYVPASGIPLTYPGRAFGPRYWQGLHDLTGRANPWLRDLIPDAKKLSAQRGQPPTPTPLWAQMLADYHLSPAPEKLALVETACKRWIAATFHRRDTRPPGIMPFYNSGFYPCWWDLPDLYEITGDQDYLAAAEQGGFHTLAGLWSHPRAPAGDITLHPGGRYSGGAGAHLFWKGTEKYRLGSPRHPGDAPERRVPAWKVSRVGLGIEQPVTLYQDDDDNGMRNILNAAYAPALLRLASLTGRDIFKIYARNAIIGRFGNYPGYYVNGFTDIHMYPDYPYTGPDTSDIYYHHIPVHLAFTLDYLFAEAETLSGGAIRFPWVKQQDYVWFVNRIYGHAPGAVYGESGLWPWLDRKAFSVDSPRVNCLGALGNAKLDVIVTNSSRQEARATLRLDRSRTGVAAGSAWHFLVNGKTTRQGRFAADAALAAELPFTLPVGAVGVFRFSSEKQSLFEKTENKPLDARPVRVNLPSPWGSLHAIRIRSPFGTDSLYIYATQMAPAGSVMKLRFREDNGASLHPVREARTAPFEITVTPFPIQKTARFVVELTNPEGDAFVSAPVELPGTP
jgi:hypothetical protein